MTYIFTWTMNTTFRLFTACVILWCWCGLLYEHGPSFQSSNFQPAWCSRVERKHTLVVASDEQGRWKVFSQNVQPGHVQEVRDGLLAGDGHAPAGVYGEYVGCCVLD